MWTDFKELRLIPPFAIPSHLVVTPQWGSSPQDEASSCMSHYLTATAMPHFARSPRINPISGSLITLLFATVLINQARGQDGVFESANCAVKHPPAAEIILPQTPLAPGGTIAIELIIAADVEEITVTLSEKVPAFNPRARAAIDLTESLGGRRKGERQRVYLPMPAELMQPGERQLKRRAETEHEIVPTLLTFHVNGRMPDGGRTHSSEVITFRRLGHNSYQVVTLHDYLQEYGDEPGSLYELPQEEIKGVALDEYDSEPDVISRSARIMDERGAVVEVPSTRDTGIPPEHNRGNEITVTVSGYIYLTSYDGTSQPFPYAEVGIWEDDGNQAYLAPDHIVRTNSQGYYSVTVTHDDGDSALELFLETRSINNRVSLGNAYLNGENDCNSNNNHCGLTSSNNVYQWQGPLVTGVTDGSITMNYTISDYRRGGAQVFKWLNDAANFTHTAYSPGLARAVWGLPGEGAASIESQNYNLIFTALNGIERAEDVAYHEYGHLTMFRRNSYRHSEAYGDHYYNTLIHPAFAWVEGWPTGYAQHVKPDGVYNSPYGSPTVNVEEPSRSFLIACCTGHNEFWVAAAVNDFYDLADDGVDDNYPVSDPEGDALVADVADRIYTFSQEMAIIRDNDIDSIVEFYNILRTSYLTAEEASLASRVMRHNAFNVEYVPPPNALNASIFGPGSLSNGQTGTWNANVSGGSGAIFYEWKYMLLDEDDGCNTQGGGPVLCGPTLGVWSNGGTSSSFSQMMGNTFNRIKIWLRVQRGTETVDRYLTVYKSGNRLEPLAAEGNKAAGEGKLATGDSAASLTNTGNITSAGMGSSSGAFSMSTIYPNPSIGRVTFSFSVPETVDALLVIYDALGREVERIAEGTISAGSYRAHFDGSALPSGTYLARFQAGEYFETHTFVLVK